MLQAVEAVEDFEFVVQFLTSDSGIYYFGLCSIKRMVKSTVD